MQALGQGRVQAAEVARRALCAQGAARPRFLLAFQERQPGGVCAGIRAARGDGRRRQLDVQRARASNATVCDHFVPRLLCVV